MPSDKSYKRPRGQPYYEKADNGVFYVHWSEGRRSKRESLGVREEDEARTRFAQWLLLDVGKKTGVGAKAVSYTIAELWGVYMDKHVKPHLVGQVAVTGSWQNLEPHFAGLTVEDFTQDQVDAYAEKRRAGRIGRPSKDITIRRELSYLVAALNFCTTAAAKRLITKAQIESVRLPHPGLPRDRWLKMEEMQRLLKAAAEMRRGEKLSRGERFLWLGLETAARKEAIMDLTWDRVDFEANVIHYDVPGRRQTKKRRAAVPISANLRPVLQRAYAERENDLVMTNKAAIWATIQFIAMRAGFSDQKVASSDKPKATGISPHVLRHTAATHMAKRGVPLFIVSKILGNSLAVVERVYAKWVPDDPAGTVDMISGGALEPAE